MAYYNPNAPIFTSSEIDIQVQELIDEVADINAELVTINGQISTINSEISTIDGTLTTLTNDVTTINGQISTINGTLTTLTNDVATINGDISTITGQITTINTSLTTLTTKVNDQQMGQIYKAGASDVNVALSAGVWRDLEATDSVFILPGLFDSLSPGFLNYAGSTYYFNITATVTSTVAAGSGNVVRISVAQNGVRSEPSIQSNFILTDPDYIETCTSCIIELNNEDFLSIQAFCANPITLGVQTITLTAVRIL